MNIYNRTITTNTNLTLHGGGVWPGRDANHLPQSSAEIKKE